MTSTAGGLLECSFAAIAAEYLAEAADGVRLLVRSGTDWERWAADNISAVMEAMVYFNWDLTEATEGTGDTSSMELDVGGVAFRNDTSAEGCWLIDNPSLSVYARRRIISLEDICFGALWWIADAASFFLSWLLAEGGLVDESVMYTFD